MATATNAACTTPETEPDRPLRFERRRHERFTLPGEVTAIRIDGERFGERHGLKMLDYSPAGLGAISPSVLEPGVMVSVEFQAAEYPPRRGVVVRCLPCGNGYRLAIRFELRLAA